jgi:hypothetical protein
MRIKFTAVVLLLAALMASSCAQLKRNNPYDPAGDSYLNITYKGEAWYPMSTDIKAMIVNQGFLVFGAYMNGPGDCVIKMTGAQSFTTVGSTGLTTGSFTNINDITNDTSGNIYVVDKTTKVQVINAANTVTSFPLATANVDKLYIECFNNNIYVTNNLDMTVTKFNTSGAMQYYTNISTTAMGYFVPGRIFKSSGHLFVVNDLDKTQVVRLLDNGSAIIDSGTHQFSAEINDGATAISEMQLVSDRVVYKVDDNLVLTLKWGNFGEGPGNILNGKLCAYDSTTALTYILDGSTIKIFGE